MNQVTAIIAARMQSTRLPGKVLLPVMGRPLLFYQIERVAKARSVTRIVVATGDRPADDPLAAFCRDQRVDCFRGSPADVLDRIFRAAEHYRSDPVIRLTADDPLADPAVLERLIALFQEGACDYASNVNPPTFPDGLDIEILSFKTLHKIWRETTDANDREHVTRHLRKHLAAYRTRNLELLEDLSGLHWAVDTSEDFEFVRSVFEALYPRNPDFGLADVLALFRNSTASALKR